MSVTASDIKIHAAVNMPEDNTSTVGGAVNTGIILTFTDIVATDTVRVSGSSTADTGAVIIRGRNTAGSIVSETVEHVGITGFRSSTQQFERVLDVRRTTSSLFVGTISFYDNSTETEIGTLPPGITGFRRPFFDAAADSAGGSTRHVKEKGFVTNLNEINALLNASLTEVSSGIFAKVQYAIESGSFGSSTIPSRTGTTLPTGITASGNGPINFPNVDLDPQESIGLWLFLSLDPGDAASNSFAQISIEGSTT